MQSTAATADEYIEQLPEDRQSIMSALRNAVRNNLPAGFEEAMQYGMITYVVPHSIYPNGYHCDPKLPLPFLSLASQKNFIALYHMGIYMSPPTLDWFVSEYNKRCSAKPDMGKSCIRFKKAAQIPLDLIGELSAKFTPLQWIDLYESKLKR